MRRRSLLGCSLASPTYITSTQESAVDEEDASASSSPGTSAGPASGAPATTCNASDFAKVDLAKLTRDICMGGKLCAPAAMVSGDPVRCLLLGAPGVCLDVCFARMLSPAAKVVRGGCRPTEVCLPCLIGKGQGMPGC